MNSDNRFDWGVLFGAVVALAVVLLLVFANRDVLHPTIVGATTQQTQTAAAATRTAAASTPHPDETSDDVRALNAMSRPGGPKLGDLLQALWDGRQTGGTPSIATPGPVFDVSALTAMVRGVYLAKQAVSAQALTTCTGTGAAAYRKCTLCVSQDGTYRVEPGVSAASQAAAVQPACRDQETEVLYVEIPPAFTPGSTVPTPSWFKQNTPRSQGVKF